MSVILLDLEEQKLKAKKRQERRQRLSMGIRKIIYDESIQNGSRVDLEKFAPVVDGCVRLIETRF